MDERIVIDAEGRASSGRSFQTLASDYARFVERLRSQWPEQSPLPYAEFAGPYLESRNALLQGCEQLGTATRDAGEGQAVMAGRNRETEDINTGRVQA
ncbi:hypothetical protein [Actinomadura sp. DC4]|uniref:hypothetical protein n=1 Tax=Actinomadura sp. DC4 TaxID=3055069 RepID=UPI0025B00284|nr:hypothetical protein [Actinomadura sp. DC4]MDN3352301.1 hypothetical protein [Actinomadura sp. DC4]